MARRWRGYRLITVNGRRFRWKCDFNEPADKFSAAYARSGHEWEPDRLIVLVEENPHDTLTVTWPACEAPSIQPRDVRAAIHAAMDRNWLDAAHSLVLLASEIDLVKGVVERAPNPSARGTQGAT